MTHEQLALVLEKVAAYVGAVEAQNAELSSAVNATQAQAQTAEAEKLAELYRKATGLEADVDVMKKVAQIDDAQVKSLFTSLTKTAAADVDSMGSAHEPRKSREKVASANDPDEAFLSWCLT